MAWIVSRLSPLLRPAGLFCAALCLALIPAAGCKRSKAGETPVDAQVAESKPKIPSRPVRRRLPPPLRAIGPAGQTDDADQSPCSELVIKVCSLLTEGADECSAARARVERRPGTILQGRCSSAMEWYVSRVERPRRRVNGCRLLARAKCQAWGEESMACENARHDADRIKGELGRGCLAELLLFKGLH
jgi:hypothetical protein